MCVWMKVGWGGVCVCGVCVWGGGMKRETGEGFQIKKVTVGVGMGVKAEKKGKIQYKQ